MVAGGGQAALGCGGGGIEKRKLCIIGAKFNCVGGDYDILIYANS